MASILFVVANIGGHYPSTWGLAAQLREAGHTVTYLGYEVSRAEVEAQGFGFERAPYLLPADLPQPAGPPPPNLLKRLAAARERGRRHLEQARDVPRQVEEVVRKLRPDLMVFDPFKLGHYPPFWKHGIPAVAICATPLLSPDPIVPPYNSLLVPGRSPYRRLLVRRDWLRVRLLNAWHRLVTAWERLLTGYTPDLLWKQLAEDAGFRGKLVTRLPHINFCLPGVPEVVFTPPEFDFPRERPLPAGVAYVGPCLHLDRQEKGFPWSELPAGRGVVLCSLGRVAANYGKGGRGIDFLRRVVDAFRDDPDRVLVLVTGGKPLGDALGSIPENVRLCDWAPQLEVLSRAEAMITHGGMNSVRECVAMGVPMLVYPFRADHPGISARVVFHGLGLRGLYWGDSSAEIRRKLDELRHPAYRERVMRMREIFLRYDQRREGAAYLERLLDRRAAGSAADGSEGRVVMA